MKTKIKRDQGMAEAEGGAPRAWPAADREPEGSESLLTLFVKQGD